MPSSDNGAARPHRLKWLIALLVLTGLVCFSFWQPLQQEFTTWLLIRAEAPSETALGDVVDRAKDRVALLEKLWQTRKIVHREFVAGYLKERSGTDFRFDDRVKALLVAGTLDVDFSVRELVFGAMASRKLPELSWLAREQLREPDPQVRLLGLQYLQKANPGDVLPAVFAMLDDPDLRVVTTAESALRKWTGQDFGVRIAQSVPKADSNQRATLALANVQAIHHGVQQWKEWWKIHQQDYPPSDTQRVSPATFATQVPTDDFALPDLSGKLVRLSDFRGKTVLLNFWTTWCTACLTEIPDLVELQRRNPDRLVILGVSLDGVADEHGHNHDEAEIDHETSQRHRTTERAKIRSKVEQMVKAKLIKYPVLLDPDNAVGSRFNGGELPTNVLIDPRGCVQRRFIGARSVAIFEAMLAEIMAASPAPLR